MAEVTDAPGVVSTSRLGSGLAALLTAQDIEPGDAPSYQTCKVILSYHPLGQKMAEAPITIAQSQERKVSVAAGSDGVQELLVKAFRDEWKALRCDEHIKNAGKLSRAYGVATLALLCEGTPPDRPVDWSVLWDQNIAFNVFDPLNTAGSLVLNQNANDMDFQKVNTDRGVRVQGAQYHRSRTVVLLNEQPIYIEYTGSAFGYVGRSVYQRPLYPLKTYVLSMITDDMVCLKAGVLVAKVKQTSSAIDAIMGAIGAQKREMLKEARTFNVLQMGSEDTVESLDLKNLEQPFSAARKNVIDNIATAADMPAIILNQETFAEGFGEGVEDSKRVVQYVNGIRAWIDPAYVLMDRVVRHRAWSPKFYETVQRRFPDQYRDKTYRQAFYDWTNGYEASWPNLIEEPESETAKVDDVKLKAVIAAVETLAPLLSPKNRTLLVMWAADCFNERKAMFPKPLLLDLEDQEEFAEAQQAQAETMQLQAQQSAEEGALSEPKSSGPFSARDSARIRRSLDELTAGVARLPPPRVMRELEVMRRKVDAA